MRCSPSFALRITYRAEDCDIKGCGDFDPFKKGGSCSPKALITRF